MNERTSEDIASLAARGLNNPLGLSPDEIRKICGSALTQAPDKLEVPELPVAELPVAGYNPTQPAGAIAAVNVFKELEERVLRHIDSLETEQEGFTVDRRLLAIGRTQLQGAFMFLVRSIFQPQRVSLPEDYDWR